jgi:hypothetical protein
MPDPDPPAPDDDGLEPRSGGPVHGFLFALADAELRLADDWHPVGVATLHTTGAADTFSLEFLTDRGDVEAPGFDDLRGPGVWVELSRADLSRLARAIDRLL